MTNLILNNVMNKQLHKYYPPYAVEPDVQTKPTLFQVFVKEYGRFCDVIEVYHYDRDTENYSFRLKPFADVQSSTIAVNFDDLHSTLQFDYLGLLVRVDTLNGEFLPVSSFNNTMIEHMLTPIAASLIKMQALYILRGEIKGE